MEPQHGSMLRTTSYGFMEVCVSIVLVLLCLFISLSLSLCVCVYVCLRGCGVDACLSGFVYTRARVCNVLSLCIAAFAAHA